MFKKILDLIAIIVFILCLILLGLRDAKGETNPSALAKNEVDLMKENFQKLVGINPEVNLKADPPLAENKKTPNLLRLGF